MHEKTPSLSPLDYYYLNASIELSRQALYRASPNPSVGCILVKDNRIIAQGHTQPYGGQHAEAKALASASESTKGATAYVTLEPCNHHGKTPPCSLALIQAGISRIVIGAKDPNPHVQGSGAQELIKAGIQVDWLDQKKLYNQIIANNRGFFSMAIRQKPWVQLKIAQSLDGNTALRNGKSRWITGELARMDVHHLRAKSDALITGIGTVLKDDPLLNARINDLDIQQPWRVVLDRSLQISPHAKLFTIDSPIIIGTKVAHGAHQNAQQEKLLQVHSSLSFFSLHDDLSLLLQILFKEQKNTILIEAGPTLSSAFLAQDLVDELIIYQSSHLLGNAQSSTSFDLDALPKRKFSFHDTQVLGDDIRLQLLRNRDHDEHHDEHRTKKSDCHPNNLF